MGRRRKVWKKKKGQIEQRREDTERNQRLREATSKVLERGGNGKVEEFGGWREARLKTEEAAREFYEQQKHTTK